MDLLPFGEYAASLNRKRTAAGVLFRDQQSRVLLVETTYKTEWEIPGGAVEADEAPWTTATRELREELGVERRFRDARAARVMAPTTDALNDFIGRALCGLPLLDEAPA